MVQIDVGKTSKTEDTNLAVSELDYRGLFQSAKYGIFVIDAKSGSVVEANPYALDLLCLGHRGCLGKKAWQVGLFKGVTAYDAVFSELKSKGYTSCNNFLMSIPNGLDIRANLIFNMFESDDKEFIQCNLWGVSYPEVTNQPAMESIRKFYDLIEVTSDWVWEVDTDLQFSYCSSKVQDMIGYSPDEVVGKTPFDFMPVKDANQLKEYASLLVADNKDFQNLETVNIHKNGRQVYIETNGVPFFGKDGALLGYRGVNRDITARKQAEIQHHASEQRFRLLFNNSRDALIVLDPSNPVLTSANTAALQLFGVASESQLKTLGLSDVSSERQPDGALSAKKAQKMISIAMRKGSHFFEWVFRRLDGSQFFADVLLTRMDIDGQVSLQASVRDISDRKQAEALLRKERDFSQRLIDTAPIIIMILNREGQIVRFNRYMEILSGYSLKEVKGADWFSTFLPKTEQENILSLFQSAIGDMPTDGNINAIVVKDGSQRLIEWYDKTLKDEEGNVEGLVSIGVDVTERMNIEKAVRASRDLLRSVVENIPIRVFWKDKDLRYLGCNSMFAHDAGMSHPKQLYGKDDYQMTWRDQADIYRSDDRQVIESGTSKLGFEEPQTTPDGHTIWLRTSKVPLVDEVGETAGILGVYQDITEEREAHESLRQLNRALKTLSAANHALVHSNSEDQLLQGICRAIVEDGGYLLAWVGYAQHDETKSVKVMAAHAVTPGYTDALHITWSDAPEGCGPTGLAIRTGQTQYSQTIADNPGMAPWSERALSYGYQTSIALPLREAGTTFGVLNIYAGEPNIFNGDGDSVALLEEMAGDLAFGIHTLRIGAEHEQLWAEKQQTLEQMRAGLVETVRAIAATVEMRDPYTAGHQRRVADLAVAIARKLGMDEQQVEGLYLACIVHDLGKINVPAEILSYPGRLKDTQRLLVQDHSQIGFDILKDIHFPWPIAQIVLQHHERMDGSGYPNGLKGEGILLEAKILMVADVVEAMASHRPYRPGLGVEVALDELINNRGQLYDEKIVDVCVQLFHEEGYQLSEG